MEDQTLTEFQLCAYMTVQHRIHKVNNTVRTFEGETTPQFYTPSQYLTLNIRHSLFSVLYFYAKLWSLVSNTFIFV